MVVRVRNVKISLRVKGKPRRAIEFCGGGRAPIAAGSSITGSGK